ncbi:MAG: hypothetical protein ACW99F_15575 [Candidatus Hodarchaeales archaeon]|jgi:hypothetical protein
MNAIQTEEIAPTPPAKKRSLNDNLRQLKFNLTAVRADLKYLRRVIFRELRYFIPITDLVILLLMLLSIAILIILVFLFFIPFLLQLINSPINLVEFRENFIDFILSSEVLRLVAAIIGIVTIIVRLMIKSPINKYRGKVNARKDVTYIFGSSKPAEQFLFEMVHRYGYEERVSLIADADLLWIRKLKAFIDLYVVEDSKEFEKPNLYEIIGFENASRIMILSESVELNQNILTNIRQVRPDVEIVILSQYAPNFVFSDLVQDDNLTLIEDLDVTVQGLVLSLSLDFHFPLTSEIDVPRTYVGHKADTMSFDIPKMEVILIRRGNEYLPSTEVLLKDDRIIVFYYSNFDMKRTNRIITELPFTKKKRKKEKDIEIKKSHTDSTETTSVDEFVGSPRAENRAEETFERTKEEDF